MKVFGLNWDEIMQAAWESKAWKPVIILLLCWGLFIALKFGLKQFEKYLSRSEVIRENEMVLRLKTFIHVDLTPSAAPLLS